MSAAVATLRRIYRRFRKPPQPVLQEHFFRLALAEVGLAARGISIDHKTGTCTQADLGTVPLVFPLALVERVAALPKTKTTDTFFRGVITEQRAWVRDYAGVAESHYGRDTSTKYEFHEEYYAGLCASRFALAPVGDCPWSYRFFEAIMGHALPVLGDEDVDVFADGFAHLRHSDQKIWDEATCRRNYAKFLEEHTLPGRFPYLRVRAG